MIRIVLFLFALLAASAAQAQVFKCLDAAGRTVYRQDPCPASMKRESMAKPGITAPAAAPADAAGKAAKGPMTPAQQEQAFRQRQQDASKAAKEADAKSAEAKLREQNCAGAKQNLATYELGGRISRVDANGERYYMEDSQVEAEKAKARAQVSQFCN